MKYRGTDDIKKVMKNHTKQAIARVLMEAWNYMDMEHEVLEEMFGLMATQNIETEVSRRIARIVLKDLGAEDDEIERILNLTDDEILGEMGNDTI